MQRTEYAAIVQFMDYYESRLRSPLVVGIVSAVVAAVVAAAITAWWIGRDGAQIEAGQVTTALIADSAVDQSKIANGAVSADKLAANALGPDAIPDGAIDTARIADEAVTQAKLAPGAVDADQIADGAITAKKVAPGVVKSLDEAIAAAKSEADQALAGGGSTYTPTVTIASKNFSGTQGNAACPSGATAIAGGVSVNNESTSLVSSYPSGRNGAEPTGWAVLISGSGGGTVYATCIK